ncbi:MAG: bifunctional 2-C-methyl-D-erythritol 4-phosphate cytidylyltransferase/2-C-methyl-D-erythritol 2,4-cyclodiphosphate synthase [Pseudomonadota bacterium]
MKTAMIVVAGGQGIRAGGRVPKQYQLVAGKPILHHALVHAADCPEIDHIQVVIGDDHKSLFDEMIREAPPTVGEKLAPVVNGGASRQQSTLAGLQALPDTIETVLVHDAARPFLPGAVIRALLEAVEAGVGAVPTLRIPDSVKRLEIDRVIEDPNRDGLVRAQTPQAFRRNDLLAAFAAASTDGYTDEASLARSNGIRIVSVPGSEALFKITQPDDFAKAEAHMQTHLPDVRTGMGFDVHAFEPGDHAIICGVPVPHTHKLKGHSDADVGLHALTDAIFGALGDGDIGDHFPPSDPQWKGAASDAFLRFAVERVKERGGVIGHADITLICERPKIGPFRQAMKDNVASLLGVAHDRVSIKATTTEKLGFTGRQEGIAAQAVATIRLP